MADQTFPVEAGHIMLFARSVGDPNPVYADAAYAAGTETGRHHRPADVRPGERAVQPGLLPAAQDRPALVRIGPRADRPRPIRPRLGRRVLGRRRPRRRRAARRAALRVPPAGAARRRPHAHRPAPGKTWERTGRSGLLKFSESVTEYRDAERRAGRHRPQRRRHDQRAPAAANDGEGTANEPVQSGDQRRRHPQRGGRRQPDPDPDRPVRGGVGRLQPAAHRRDLRDQGGRVPDRLRPRHADDGPHRPDS